jgi:peptide/nickel transport system permease protein
MLAFIARRLAYGFATVLGVLAVLFVLFFAVTDPDQIARRAVGERAAPETYEAWKRNHGYDKPLLINRTHDVVSFGRYTDTLLVEHFRRMLSFEFGRSDADDAPIWQRIKEGIGPSLSLTVPLFLLGLVVGIALSLFVAFFRETYIDRSVLVLCMLGMSIASLIYIVGGQYLIGKLLKWFPISGFDPNPAVIIRFLAIPVLVGVLAEFGGTVRLYRTVFLEEANRDYVRTARAKGAGEVRVMVRHVLRNALLPILTNVVLAIPFLFIGSILFESFFGIPGLGALTVEAINGNDFSTLRTMVYIGALLFIAGQILTDISYSLADPRVRLGEGARS